MCEVDGCIMPCIRGFLCVLGVSVDAEATQVFTAHHGKVFSLHFASVHDGTVLITSGPEGITVRRLPSL